MSYRAVIFDLGGVVLGSPLHAIARYERELGLPAQAINRVVAETAPHGAWARLERGELSMEDFFPAFEEDCRRAGHAISAPRMFAEMARASEPRPAMLEAIGRIRAAGLRVAALTNNWRTPDAGATAEAVPHALAVHFDLFVESSVEGLRKPDPRIYELVCRRLDVVPSEAVFLDDIGANLKPARAMGITTIRVLEPEPALRELESHLGIPLSRDT